MHRDLPTAPDAPGPVKVPGDPERDHMAKCEEMGGTHCLYMPPPLPRIFDPDHWAMGLG